MSVSDKKTTKNSLLYSGLTLIFVLLAGCETPKPVPVTVPGAPAPIAKAAISGVPQSINDDYSINADCSSAGLPVIKIIDSPEHGTITLKEEPGYTNFSKDNQRFECNKQKVPMVKVVYTSVPNYVGSDRAKIMVIYPGGNFRYMVFEITVK